MSNPEFGNQPREKQRPDVPSAPVEAGAFYVTHYPELLQLGRSRLTRSRIPDPDGIINHVVTRLFIAYDGRTDLYEPQLFQAFWTALERAKIDVMRRGGLLTEKLSIEKDIIRLPADGIIQEDSLSEAKYREMDEANMQPDFANELLRHHDLYEILETLKPDERTCIVAMCVFNVPAEKLIAPLRKKNVNDIYNLQRNAMGKVRRRLRKTEYGEQEEAERRVPVIDVSSFVADFPLLLKQLAETYRSASDIAVALNKMQGFSSRGTRVTRMWVESQLQLHKIKIPLLHELLTDDELIQRISQGETIYQIAWRFNIRNTRDLTQRVKKLLGTFTEE